MYETKVMVSCFLSLNFYFKGEMSDMSETHTDAHIILPNKRGV